MHVTRASRACNSTEFINGLTYWLASRCTIYYTGSTGSQWARNGLTIQPHTTMQCHTGSTQCNAMSHGLNSMQCNVHGLNGLHGLTMRHSSSTGSPSRCIICYTGSTGSQWTCSSASYNNVTSSMQCNITRAQRAPRAYQKLAELACYTGSTGSKRISIAFINISHYICHNFGYT